MNLTEIKESLKTKDYSFLRENQKLGNNIILLTLGGSHAYGTNKEGSDIDIRGCALNTSREILLGEDYEQIVDIPTDTTIYSFNKLLTLLANVNPNTIEMLGCKKEQYLHLSPIGQELLDNKKMFLSKKAIHSFGGYATAQMRRLDNKAVRLVGQEEREKHILNSIMCAYHTFPEKYFDFDEDSIKLYIDKAVQRDFETEIFMDVNLHHYPLRDYKGMWAEMHNIIRDYAKLGKRNKNAIEHNKLGKHMMHLIRLYMMCIDILENEEIITCREKEHDFLMEIRNGKYLDENQQPIPEFYEMINEYEKRLDYAAKNTSLPELPDYERINEFKMSVNERIIKGEI